MIQVAGQPAHKYSSNGRCQVTTYPGKAKPFTVQRLNKTITLVDTIETTASSCERSIRMAETLLAIYRGP